MSHLFMCTQRHHMLALGLLICGSAWGLTRWSSVHMIPDADMLKGGEIVADGQMYLCSDVDGGIVARPTLLAHLGIIEWVNLHIGYAGGFTMGFKARILGETHPLMPSLAVGAHNLFSHKETNYYYLGDSLSEGVANEFFLALGKTIEPFNLRFHLGMQTIPADEKERFNPFFGVEKYFGVGLYTSLEVHRRHEEFVPSLFVGWRFLRKRLEVSAGLVGLTQMLFNEDGEFAVSLQSRATDTTFVRPGIWIGIRFLGDLKFGSRDGFTSLDDRVNRQGVLVENLEIKVDSLSAIIDKGRTDLARVGTSLSEMAGDTPSERQRIKSAILDRIIVLKSLYAAEPFEPDKARLVVKEIVTYRARALPPLKELLLDKAEDRFVRTTSAMLLGEVRSPDASDALLSVLATEQDPGIKVEALIALGKLRETKAMYLLQQLANDPNDAVAMAAQEILAQLEKETGVKVSGDIKMRQIDTTGTPAVSEESRLKTPVADRSSVNPPPAAPAQPPAAQPAAQGAAEKKPAVDTTGARKKTEKTR